MVPCDGIVVAVVLKRAVSTSTVPRERGRDCMESAGQEREGEERRRSSE